MSRVEAMPTDRCYPMKVTVFLAFTLAGHSCGIIDCTSWSKYHIFLRDIRLQYLIHPEGSAFLRNGIIL